MYSFHCKNPLNLFLGVKKDFSKSWRIRKVFRFLVVAFGAKLFVLSEIPTAIFKQCSRAVCLIAASVAERRY